MEPSIFHENPSLSQHIHRSLHHRRRRCHFHHHLWVYVIQHLLINMHLIFDGILTSYRFYTQSRHTLYVCISSSHFPHNENPPDTIFGIVLLFDFVMQCANATSNHIQNCANVIKQWHSSYYTCFAFRIAVMDLKNVMSSQMETS